MDLQHPYWRFAERWNGRLAMVGVVSLVLIKCLSQFSVVSQQPQHTAMYSHLYFNDTLSSTINFYTSRLQRLIRVWIFCRSWYDSRFFRYNMIFLISIMSFANFVFYPLVIGCIVAFVIESIFRAQKKAPQVLRSMAVRKYFWRQAWLFNIIWFVGYFILLIVNRPGAQQMPDMIWQG